MHYGNRFRKAKFITSPIALFGLVIVMAILAKASYNIYSKQSVSEERLAQATEELSRLEDRRVLLENNLGLLSSAEGIEAELRTKYRAVKPGESVAVIVSSTDPVKVTAASLDAPVLKKKGFIYKLLQIVGL